MVREQKMMKAYLIGIVVSGATIHTPIETPTEMISATTPNLNEESFRISLSNATSVGVGLVSMYFFILGTRFSVKLSHGRHGVMIFTVSA